MGSNAEAPLQDDEITVLVTGFGPFRPQNPVNPAWEIARGLPPFLRHPKHHSTSDVSSIASNPPIRLLLHPEQVKVSYTTVRELVPKLWDGRKIDYAVHIGMATGRKYYSVERRAHRDGYAMKDVDEEFLGDAERKKEEGDKWIWHGLPEEFLTSADIDDVWKRWRIALPTQDIRISEDAGRYLCDFIYYSSMAHLTRKDEERRVVFFHVPVEADDAAIKSGIEVAIELIRALVQSGRTKKLVQQ